MCVCVWRILGHEYGQKWAAYLSGQEVLEVNRKHQPLWVAS